MKDNYFINSNFPENIHLFNPNAKQIVNNKTFTNSISFEENKTHTNSDESLGIEELPPMDEDVDHLKNFNLQNRNKIYHFNNLSTSNNINQNEQRTRSFSVKANNLNNELANQNQFSRKTEGFYMHKQNNLNYQYYPNKNILIREKPPERALKSRYSSASENKYHFMHKLSKKPEFILNYTQPNDIQKVNYAPIDSNRIFKNNSPPDDSDLKYFNNNIDNLYSNKTQSEFSSPTIQNKNIVNNNTIQNRPFSERENKFKQVSNYGYKTLNVKNLQNNIQLEKLNEFKTAQLKNKILNNNELISGFNLTGNVVKNNQNNYFQPTIIQNYYEGQRLTNINSINNQFFNNINLANQKQRNTFYEAKNNNIDQYFNYKNNPQISQGRNFITFNQAVKNVKVQNKEPEIAIVTKITDNDDINKNKNNNYENFLGGINNNINEKIFNNKIPLQNNNININFIQNNINNINIKNQNDLKSKQISNNYISHDINNLINQNIAKYITNPQPKAYEQNVEVNKKVPTDNQKKMPIKQNQKITSNYNAKDNKVAFYQNSKDSQIFTNLNLFTEQVKTNDIFNKNNYLIYNQNESERVTIANDKIQEPTKQKIKKDIDVTYNDFDGSGYVKNYGGVSRPGKDSSGRQKTNQDALVCQTNINNIKDFNLFGVLDGHGPDGHFVSQFAAEFIPSKIVNHPEIKILKEPEEIYQKLKENNCDIITQAFIEADSKLKNVDFDVFESGSTCCLVIHIGKHIICANSGDSRALVVFDNPKNTNRTNLNYWKAVPLSLDNKPELPEEMNRIIMSGGVVEQMKDELGEGCGPFRVWKRGKDYPGLAMSRSIGDLKGKEIGVIPNPGILEYDLNKSTRYIIACSDGVFEFLDNNKVMELGKHFFLQNDASAYCHELVNHSLIEWEINDNIVDDITAVVAFF